MQVFYIEIEKFKKNYEKDFLLKFADTELKTEKRFYEYTIGRFLVKSVAEQHYNISDEIIMTQTGKPVFKNGGLNFSISHSIDIVIVHFLILF